MKHIIYTAFILLLASACSKPAPSPETEKEQYGRYIFFSQQVSTKADLIESAAAMDQFGVVGFKYEGTWADKKASLTPNVFYDDNGNLVNTAETLTCNDDGTADYAPLQGWSSFKNYAFFAYYPIDQAVTLVNDDGTPYTAGVPAIKYTMNQSDLKASMVDVMTAPAHTDLYWKSATNNNTNGEITFSFAHRLSCIEVKIRNSSECRINIKSIKVILAGITHSEIIIPLDGTEETKPSLDSPLRAELPLSGIAETGDMIEPSKYIEFDDKLILIPQENPVSIRVEIKYDRYRNTTGYLDGYLDHTVTLPNIEQPALTTILNRGIKHQVQLNFTDATVEISGLADTGWTETHNIEDTFN